MKKVNPYISWVLLACSIVWVTPLFASVNPSWEREIPNLDCSYSWKFRQCIVANRNGSARSIDDFVCLQSSDWEAILDQIILDVEFQEVDEEVYDYLDKLSKDKEHSVDEPNRAIDDITKNLWLEWVYYKKYRELCNGGILAERIWCTWSVPNIIGWQRIKGSAMSQECMTLVRNKLDIYTKVADGLIKLNKSEVLQDKHKEYVQQERTKYDELLNDMNMIVGSMGRLARWVTHWTPNPLQWVLWDSVKSKLSRYI